MGISIKRSRRILAAGALAVAAAVFLYQAVLRPVLYIDLIRARSAEAGFDFALVMALVRVESHFRKGARSHRGAVGLLQVMPDTSREMAPGLGRDPDTIDLEDPDTNLRIGLRYLNVLRAEFGNDTVRVLAAYNAGPTHARRWSPGGPLAVDMISFGETRSFVRRVLKTERLLKLVFRPGEDARE